jgi:hypothetical protein
MNYTKKSFAVGAPGTKEYAENWERTFRPVEPPIIAKACPVCGSFEHEKHEPEHKP